MKQVFLITLSLLLIMAGIVFCTKHEKKITTQNASFQIYKVDSLENLVKIDTFNLQIK